MKTIWKYEIEVNDQINLDMPGGSKILDIQNQDGKIYMWAIVNTKNNIEKRSFLIYGTGHKIDVRENLKYIGTFQVRDGSLVFHLFENLSVK